MVAGEWGGCLGNVGNGGSVPTADQPLADILGRTAGFGAKQAAQRFGSNLGAALCWTQHSGQQQTHHKPKSDNKPRSVHVWFTVVYVWFTYRRKFSPIGGTGPSSDAGWGCMLRCGQMMLAQALICRHLGRDWQWEKHKKQPEEYHRILRCFLDRKACCYSIHQMAQVGVGEGKSIGEWFGPNTVAQVLKKLALFDEWNSLAVYVSMGNTVVIEDIKKMCRSPPQSSSASHSSAHLHRSALGRSKNAGGLCTGWQPLLLIIPLRLGINHINPVYIDAFKECFKMPQSLGALGGKPNNAYYFIGFLGNELIYLDPHTTQSFVDSEENGTVDDESFHCQEAPHRMKIMNLDPSVALGFFCKEECDFDNWCSLVQKEILKQQSLRMLELVQKHPPHWPPFIPPTKPEVTTTRAGKAPIKSLIVQCYVPR
ncbi:cysteine protease ATG4A-like [Anas acuta]|uniref:cysteine protease ATG4A-like n=1 Tax=Anas acuta TaxID=28680 RepID=UPI0035C91CA4